MQDYWTKPDVAARVRQDRMKLVTDLRKASNLVVDVAAASLMIQAADEIESLDYQLWQVLGAPAGTVQTRDT